MTDRVDPTATDRPPTPVWQLGRFRFHAGTRQLASDEGSQPLTLKSAEVLKRLIAGAGEVVSRDQLIAEVWHGNSYTGSQALTHTIWQLRRVLDAGADSGDSIIATVSKSGYRLTVPASPVAQAVQAVQAEGAAPAVAEVAGGSPAGACSTAGGDAVAAASSGAARDAAPAASHAAAPAATASPLGPARRRPWVALAALAAAGLALVIAALWLALRPLSPPPGALTAPPQPLTMQDGVEDFPAYSPDGQRLAYTWQGAEGPARIRIDDMGPGAHGLPQEITDPAGHTLARPVWLGPRRLAYVRANDAADCRVEIVDLDTGARRDVAACYYARGQPVLDASPDGAWLAMARQGSESASVGIVLHRLADGAERALTRPPAGFDDAEIAWSHDGRRIAFLRSNATVGDLYLVEVAGATADARTPPTQPTRLTRDEAPVGGLTWASDDAAIVFNSARGGSFATWRLAPAGGEPSLFARIDTPLNLAAVPGQPQAVAASVHRFSDHIELYRLADGKLLSSITSSGRDLYGQACPSSQQVVFNSLRSGRVELWRSDGQGRDARRIAMPAGIPEPVACALGGQRFATALRPPGAEFDQLVFGELEGGPPRLYSEAAHFTNLTWGVDGRSVIVASDREGALADRAAASAPNTGAAADGPGDWDLWRLDVATRRLQRLTDDHGSFGREVRNGGALWLYYARLGQPGLWRRPLAADGSAAGPPQRVSDRLATDDWGNWQWHAGALWLIERAASEDRLVQVAADGSTKTVLRLPRGFVRPYSSLSIGDDGVALLTVSGPRQADIMRIGPF